MTERATAYILFGFLAAITVAAKVAKIAMSYAEYVPPERVAVALGVLLTVGLAAIALGSWAVRRIRHEVDGMAYGATVVATFVFVILVSESIVAAAFGGYRGVLQKTLAVFAWDAVLIVSVVFACLPALFASRAPWRQIGRGAAYLLCWILMALALLDLVYFMQTGLNADWTLFDYTFGETGLVASAVSDGLSNAHVLVLAVPTIVIGVAMWSARIARRRKTLNPYGGEGLLPWLAGFGVAMLVAAILIPDRTATEISRPFVGNAAIEVVRDGVSRAISDDPATGPTPAD